MVFSFMAAARPRKPYSGPGRWARARERRGTSAKKLHNEGERERGGGERGEDREGEREKKKKKKKKGKSPRGSCPFFFQGRRPLRSDVLALHFTRAPSSVSTPEIGGWMPWPRPWQG